MSLSTKNANRLERVRYFPRQLMTAEDMRTEQDYFVERLRRHNRLLHGWGIICGLQVLPDATADQPWRVKVCPGSAVAVTGDEIDVARPVWFDLASPPDPTDAECLPCPCPPGPPMASSAEGATTHYLAIRYLCRPARPVRTGHTECGCGDGCETSRWRDDYELGLLSTLEGPYANEWAEDELQWLTRLKKALTAKSGLIGLPTRSVCPQTDYPWIILATVTANLSAPPPAVATNPGPQNNLTQFLGAAAEVHRRPLVRAEDLLKLLEMK
jgi:hypothetical protein